MAAAQGKHVLHAYTPATEPYSLWEGLDRSSPEYKKLKEERSQVGASCVYYRPLGITPLLYVVDRQRRISLDVVHVGCGQLLVLASHKNPCMCIWPMLQ